MSRPPLFFGGSILTPTPEGLDHSRLLAFRILPPPNPPAIRFPMVLPLASSPSCLLPPHGVSTKFSAPAGGFRTLGAGNVNHRQADCSFLFLNACFYRFLGPWPPITRFFEKALVFPPLMRFKIFPPLAYLFSGLSFGSFFPYGFWSGLSIEAGLPTCVAVYPFDMPLPLSLSSALSLIFPLVPRFSSTDWVGRIA